MSFSAARFLAQEEKRLLMVGKNILSEREERKRIRARERYEKLFQSLVGVTICLPEAFHDKVAFVLAAVSALLGRTFTISAREEGTTCTPSDNIAGVL